MTGQILQAIQLANEQHNQQMQRMLQQQQLGLQAQAQPSEIALRQAQTGQAQAGTAETQAQTAAGLPAAQAEAIRARTALEQTQNAAEMELNPIKKKQLQTQADLEEINLQRAQASLKFLTGGGVDSQIKGVRDTLGQLAPDEKALMDAAENSTKYDLGQGRPDALNHIQQATNEISNNRRAVKVAELFQQTKGDITNKDYYNTETNQLEQLTPNEFNKASKDNPGRYIQYTSTVANAIKAQGLVNDIQDGIDNMKKVLSDPKLKFSAEGRALLARAQADPQGMVNAVLSGAATEHLSQPEKNYFMAKATLDERAMAMRGLQGQGSGSDAQREAIVRMLPGIATADTQMGKDQLKLFQNNLDNLNNTIPKFGKQSKKTAGGSAPGGAVSPTGGMSPAAAGYLQGIGVGAPAPTPQ